MHTYTYDAENRIISVDSGAATYVYDADGQRVRKTVGGASTDYLYDLAGHAITEVNASGWQRGEVYAGGRHVATYASGTTYFVHMDWLGTERVHTAVSGAVCETVKSLPFGDGESATGSCDPSTRHFTGKMRDAETNLDNFEARYYSSALGRFMIPDWDAKATAVPYAAYGNPQTLNLYGYVGNNPITETDATGHAGDSPPAQFPIYGAEPLDVTGGDNAHWEPQVDVDPSLLNDHAGESGLNNDLDSLSNAAVGNTQATTLSNASEQAILKSNLTGPQAIAFEDAVLSAGQQTGIDPNILVGIAAKESTLGRDMNGSGGKGLFGIEEGKNGDLAQINKMFGSGITHADLLSLDASSISKVTLGVAQFLQHYANIYSNSTDPRGIDVALSVWRMGIGTTRANIRAGNFWDYVDPVLNESVHHYVDKVEEYQ